MTSIITWLKRLFFGTSQRGPGVSPFPVGTGPARLVVLRHAEKTGEKSDPHLSRAGSKRAKRLAKYLPETFGTPDFLIAARTSKRSRRPVETMEPLAAALELPIRDDLDDSDIAEVVEVLRDTAAYRGKFGVLSWRHSDIPALIEALGAPDDTLPRGWDEDDFTTIIDFSFTDGVLPRARRVEMPF